MKQELKCTIKYTESSRGTRRPKHPHTVLKVLDSKSDPDSDVAVKRTASLLHLLPRDIDYKYSGS